MLPYFENLFIVLKKNHVELQSKYIASSAYQTWSSRQISHGNTLDKLARLVSVVFQPEISQFEQLLKLHRLRFGQHIKLSCLSASHLQSVEYTMTPWNNQGGWLAQKKFHLEPLDYSAFYWNYLLTPANILLVCIYLRKCWGDIIVVQYNELESTSKDNRRRHGNW